MRLSDGFVRLSGCWSWGLSDVGCGLSGGGDGADGGGDSSWQVLLSGKIGDGWHVFGCVVGDDACVDDAVEDWLACGDQVVEVVFPDPVDVECNVASAFEFGVWCGSSACCESPGFDFVCSFAPHAVVGGEPVDAGVCDDDG